MLDFETQVDKGIALLTAQVGPTWYDAVSTDRLDLNDVHDCIFGQLFGHYGIGCQKFWFDERCVDQPYPVTTLEQDDKAAEYGFNLTDAYSDSPSEGDRAFAELKLTWVHKIRLLSA